MGWVNPEAVVEHDDLILRDVNLNSIYGDQTYFINYFAYMFIKCLTLPLPVFLKARCISSDPRFLIATKSIRPLSGISARLGTNLAEF